MLTLTDIYSDKENGMYPFSNGTEAMMWRGANCDSCTRNRDNGSYDHEYLESMAEKGMHCMGEVGMGLGYVFGYISREVAEWIGATRSGASLPAQCRYYTRQEFDDEDPVGPLPEDPHQLLLPFDPINELFFNDPEIIITPLAIYSPN